MGGQRNNSLGHLDESGVEEIAKDPISQESYMFMYPHMIRRSMMFINESVVSSFAKNKAKVGLSDFCTLKRLSSWEKAINNGNIEE